MAYDETLAARIRKLLGRQRVAEKKMFGGVGFLRSGNMCVGVWKDSLIARVGPDDYRRALDEPHAKEFDVTGRAMNGWVMVAPEGLADDDQLAAWIERATAFVDSLPPK